MTSTTTLSVSFPSGAQGQNASHHPQHAPSAHTATNTRPKPPHTHSAPILATNPSNLSGPVRNASTTSAPERPTVPRGYTAHLPYNPDRPPPHTYTRQHEFPPFPPLAQHPVLPFLTTAFTNPQESQNAPPAKARPQLAARTSSGRHSNSMVSTIPTMDVSKNDPTAVFIHPPLMVPLSRNNDPSIDPSCMSGGGVDGEPAPGTPLTYAILHNHRNWFLDADDFRKDNPNRIDYPHDLEPPRGWAPLSECTGAGAASRCKQAKEKKEKSIAVRTKGSYGHADNAVTDTTIECGPSDDCHEKTVLRCTFCRREYHGPNAKSMWRRHVFDKHKVAMKNRREGSAGMAPRTSQAQKKSKAKITDTSSALGPPVDLSTPTPTLDLSNEENLLRLLERVVSGNLDISLPANLLNSSNGNTVNFETLALALQKSGICLAAGGSGVLNPQLAASAPQPNSNPEPGAHAKRTGTKSRKRDEQRRERERRDEEIMRAAAGPSLGVDDEEDIASSQVTSYTVDDGAWDSPSKFPIFQTSPSSPTPESDADAAVRHGQKRKAEETAHDSAPLVSSNLERAPLRDNTASDRNNHNQSSRKDPGTPRKDKGKQKAHPITPGAPKLSQESFLSSSPLLRHPYTPVKPPTALRSRALATTGEESYLTLIVRSPATSSPIRGSGRVSFTSPFHAQTTPAKRSDRDYPPPSEDALGNITSSSPHYTFEFNLHNSSPFIFEPIPLELGSLGPAHWTPPPLGPPAHVSQSTSRSLSRASSVGDDVDADDKDEDDDDEGDMELKYPDSSSPSECAQYRRRSSMEDFDMDAYLDLDDAGPSSESNLPASPYKTTAARGLQFSKEYGLLSPSEVERITASVLPGFVEEARSSKRRKVEVS